MNSFWNFSPYNFVSTPVYCASPTHPSLSIIPFHHLFSIWPSFLYHFHSLTFFHTLFLSVFQKAGPSFRTHPYTSETSTLRWCLLFPSFSRGHKLQCQAPHCPVRLSYFRNGIWRACGKCQPLTSCVYFRRCVHWTDDGLPCRCSLWPSVIPICHHLSFIILPSLLSLAFTRAFFFI